MDAKDREFLHEIFLDTCVFCKTVVGTEEQGIVKVLSCLHLACKTCVEFSLSDLNKVVCELCEKEIPDPGHGESLVDSLPDWPGWQAMKEDGQSATHVPTEDNTALEPQAKKARAVRGDPEYNDSDPSPRFSSGGRDRAVQVPKCRIHNTSDLVNFCKTCRIFLCDVCPSTLTLHKLHDVVAVDAGAKSIKERFSKRLAGLSDSKTDEKLALKKEWLEKQKENIKTKTEAMSQDITTDFNVFRAREQKLLEDLETVSWARQENLKKREQQLDDIRGRLKISRHLVECLDQRNLLRAAKSVANSLENDILEEAVTGVLEQEEDCALGAKYIPLSKNIDTEVQTYGMVRPEGDDSTSPEPCLPRRPTALDPTLYCTAFDSQRTHNFYPCFHSNNRLAASRDFTVDKNLTAEISLSSSSSTTCARWCVIYGRGTYSDGIRHCRLQFLDDPGDSVFGTSGTRRTNNREEAEGFHGWSNQRLAPAKYGPPDIKHEDLGQPWEAGDILLLTLDFTQRLIFACHERTGATDQLRLNLKSPMATFTVFLPPNSSVMLLPPKSITTTQEE